MPEESRRRRRGGPETSIRNVAIWESVLATAAALQVELGRELQVVDLGGGTGGLAVALAGHGHAVTVVDPSPDALASLERRARDVGVADRIEAVQGDAATLGSVVPDGRADLLCCHGVLEVVDDPAAALASLERALASAGVLSLVVAQRLAVVLARALAGHFTQARAALTSADGRWGAGDPVPRRFDADEIRALLDGVGLEVVDLEGVRVFADLVPESALDGEADRIALLELEREIARHPSYAFLGHLASALHVTARHRG